MLALVLGRLSLRGRDLAVVLDLLAALPLLGRLRARLGDDLLAVVALLLELVDARLELGDLLVAIGLVGFELRGAGLGVGDLLVAIGLVLLELRRPLRDVGDLLVAIGLRLARLFVGRLLVGLGALVGGHLVGLGLLVGVLLVDLGLLVGGFLVGLGLLVGLLVDLGLLVGGFLVGLGLLVGVLLVGLGLLVGGFLVGLGLVGVLLVGLGLLVGRLLSVAVFSSALPAVFSSSSFSALSALALARPSARRRSRRWRLLFGAAPVFSRASLSAAFTGRRRHALRDRDVGLELERLDEVAHARGVVLVAVDLEDRRQHVRVGHSALPSGLSARPFFSPSATDLPISAFILAVAPFS